MTSEPSSRGVPVETARAATRPRGASRRIPPGRAIRTALVALAALAGAGLDAAVRAPDARAEIGDKLDQMAPEIDCTVWSAGAPQQLTKLRGRVVILHLSDPDSLLSKATVAPLRKVQTAWKDAPVSIVEIVLSPTRASSDVYAAKELPPWPVGWDGKGVTASRFPGTSVPRTYLIGPEGRIVWHAHLGALTKEIVQAQVDRIAFFEPAPEVKKARAVAKAAAEQRFGAALAEAAKVEADRYATDADRALCAAVRKDIDRTWELQKKVLDALVKENDWGLAWRRATKMKEMFDGTPKGPESKAELKELEDRPIVPHIRAAQELFEKILEDAVKAKTRNDIEAAIGRCHNFETKYGGSRPGDRSVALREQLEKKLEALGGK